MKRRRAAWYGVATGEKLEIVLARPDAQRCVGYCRRDSPNPGETLIETAARETREETGLEVVRPARR